MARFPSKEGLAQIARVRGLQREQALLALAAANRSLAGLTGDRDEAVGRVDAAQRAWDAMHVRATLDLTMARLGAQALVSDVGQLEQREVGVVNGRKVVEERSQALTHRVAAADLSETLTRRAARAERQQGENSALTAAEDRLTGRRRR